MLQYLIQLNYATLIIVLCMLCILMTNHFFEKKVVRIFFTSTLCLLVLVVVESIDYWTSTWSSPSVLRICMTALGYIIRPSAIFMIILLMVKGSNFLRLFLSLPLWINAAVVFSALFTDVAYSYDANNKFVRGPLGWCPFIVCGFYLILLVVYTVVQHKNEKTSEIYISVVVAVLSMGSAILESTGRFHGLVNTTGAVSMMFYYLYLNVQQFKRDALTNTLNRRCFHLESVQYDSRITAVISVDLNNLKKLNDREGHSEGDRAIRTMVSCIRRGLVKGCRLYRTGGDEFMILCLDQKENTLYYMMERIQREMDKTEYSCAMGLAFRSEGQEFKQLCKEADQKMYENKTQMKCIRTE